MFQQIADRLEEREQRAGALRELEPVQELVLEPRHLAADEVADVQLRELVVAQVEHGIALGLEQRRRSRRPRRAPRCSDTPTKMCAVAPGA